MDSLGIMDTTKIQPRTHMMDEVPCEANPSMSDPCSRNNRLRHINDVTHTVDPTHFPRVLPSSLCSRHTRTTGRAGTQKTPCAHTDRMSIIIKLSRVDFDVASQWVGPRAVSDVTLVFGDIEHATQTPRPASPYELDIEKTVYCHRLPPPPTLRIFPNPIV